MNLLLALLLPAAALAAPSRTPDCTGRDAWPAAMAYAQLKNAGLLTPESVDFPHVAATRIASEQVARDRFRQVHLVSFPLKSGAPMDVLTVSDASRTECSLGPVTIYVVSRKLP